MHKGRMESQLKEIRLFLLVFVLASLTTIIFARTGMFSLLPVQPANLTIFVKTDKETYEIGDPLNVTIFVNSSNKPYFGSGNFSIARKNEEYKQAELTVENGVANYLVFLDLPKPGKYNVTFSVANKMNYTEINVLKKDSIILRTDKSIYAKNETIKIFGYLDFKNKTASSIDIEVFSPTNTLIANVTVEVVNNTFEFNLLPDFISDYGNYTIIAKTLNITNSTTFEVQKQKTIDIQASINKREFFYGDEIDIIANITEDGNPYNGNATISLVYPDSTIASVDSLVMNGLLSYKLIADFDENGTYKISIKVENAEKTIEFNYTNNKTQEKISVITIETNKHVLHPNETLNVNGCVILNGKLYNGNAKISLSSNITELKALTVLVSNCSFNVSFSLTDYQPGEYTIEVSSANMTNETEFYIISSAINETQEAINKTIEQKTMIVSDYRELDTPMGKFNLTTSKGKIDLFQLKGDESELAISNLTPGEKVNVSIKLPFQIPKDIEFYVWKNISGKVVLINYTLNENRDVISFELQDGKLDEDGKINGRIVDPLIIPVSKIENTPRIIASSESKVSMKYGNQIAEVEVINGTLDYFKPSVIPERLIGKNIVLPAGMFKFRISNVSGKAILRVHLTKAIDFTTKYIKFNPKTLETKSIPFKQIDPLTIEVVFEDNGPFDENPEIGIIEDDSGLASSWWNTSFKYRLPINITSSSTENISSFPAHLIVDTASLISSGKMNSDCSDIRFTFWNITSQQEEKIPYLFVGPCNTARSLIWVKLPILYDSNFNTTVLMYYGNSSASSESDASSVFPGIRAYWPFEEGSGSDVNDYSGNNYDGILADVAGGDLPSWDSSSSCKIGYCIESDDTGDAVNVSYLALNGLNNVTFEAWIKTTDDRWGLISGAGSGSDNEYLIYLETTPELRLYIKGSYDGANPGSITDGNWHHLAIVRNSDGTGAIYIDGSLLTTLSGLTTGTLSISPNGLWLMQEQDSVGGSWDADQAYIGTLDDVKIFSRSLTLDEIKKETISYSTSLGSEEYVAQLNATITYPNEGFITTRYQQFDLNATIYCNRGNCSDVYAYAQYVAPGDISSSLKEGSYSDFSDFTDNQNITITQNGLIKLQPVTGDSWFNESWNYRERINITYSDVGNLTDYSLKITMDTASLISSGKMNSDCSDILVTYYNDTSKNEEEIPYWIESGCNSANTIIWVKVPFIRNSTYGNETIYLYYGNSNANIHYSPEDVFEYFVNFTKLGVQSAYGSGQDQTPSQYEVVNDTVLHLWGNNWKGVYYGPISIAGDGKSILELEMNGTDTTEIYGVGFDANLDNVADAESTTYHFAGSQSWGITPEQSYTNFGSWQTVYAVLNDFSGQYLYFIFANDDDNDANGDVWYKNVRVRKYASTEPSVNIGSEETLLMKPSGYYVSGVIDLRSDQVKLNRIYWFDKANENTTIKVYTRSSADANTWSPWYLETNNSDVDAPDRRYFQYKVELSTTNDKQTPYFDSIVLEYAYTQPQFTNMKSSGTDFTTSTNPQTYNGLDESNSPWNVSWQITPMEKGNYTIRMFVNSSDTEIKPVQSQWINISVYEQTYITEMKIEPSTQYKGASVTISARLLDALSNPIQNQNITFKDETSGQIIGSSLTDSNGYASVVYNIPESTTIGYHTIKANYSGNASLFYFGSWATGQLKVSSSPKFWDIILSDKEIGDDASERIQVNVTDEVGLDKVILYLTYPNGTKSEFLMSYNSSTGYYEYTTEKLWQAGDHDFYIFANNTDGISNTSWQESFSVKIIGKLDIAAEKDKYKDFEVVHLSNVDDDWDFPNYTYRSVIYVYSNQTESEVPVNIQVNTSQLISEGKMNPNCSDIRFVQTMTIEELPIKISNPYGVTKYDITFPIVITDKDTLSKMKGNDIRIFTYSTNEPYANEPNVPFWVDYVTTSEAKIWVKLDVLPTAGKTIYLYYGNTSAEDKSNYTAVFTDVVGEAGIVYHNDTWVYFDYVNSTTDPKFVFASLDSYYGSDEAFTRIKMVNNSGFHVFIQESAGLDQSHAYENIGWLALRNGTWIVHGKTWQIGNASVSNSYVTINFYERFADVPVILSQIESFNEADPAKTRMDNPTANSVDIKIEETTDSSHAVENVAWFAAEPGSYYANTYIYLNKEYTNQPDDVSSTAGWTTYSAGSQPTTPAVIAKIMTEYGGDNSHERIRNVGTTSFEYAIEEEYGYDGPHTYEWNGYIAIEPNKPIYGARKLGTWPSTTEETNNKRIIKIVTVELPFWIEYGCNSENTSIWFKASYLSRGKNKIYMYYGNPSDTLVDNTEENETSVFTYPNKYGSYVVLGIDGSSLDVSSYSDSNEITLGGTSTTLNKQQTYTFTSATDVSRGNVLYSKGPVSSGTQSSGDGAPLTPFTFAGKEFVVPIARYDPIYFDFYALDDAKIQVWVSNPAGSDWSLQDEFTLYKGSSTAKSYSGTDTDATAELSYKINSTGKILVFFRGNSNDYMPLVPADTELYLEPSNYIELAALEDGTTVTIYYSNGNTPTVLNLNAGDVYTSGQLGADGSAPGVRIVSNKPVFAYQLADSDGTEATPALPRRLMDSVFVFPQDAEYFVAVTPANEVTECSLYNSAGSLVAGPWVTSGTTNEPGKIGYGTGQDGTTYINAGYKLVCNNTVFVYYEQAANDAETLIYGPKAHAKYLDVSAEIAYEEDKWVNLENNGNETLRGYLWAIVQRYDDSTGDWVNIPPAIINDLATSNLRVLQPGESINLTQLWESQGAWNTSDNPAGKYRILFKFTDPEGNTIYDYELRALTDYFVFEIVPANISLENITYENKFNYNLNEYETGDTIKWINATIKAFNDSAINTVVHLTLIDSSGSYAGFGPNDETYDCGLLYENTYCIARFDNSSYGYPIPNNLEITSKNYTLKVNVTLDNGDDYINTTNNITIHNIPSTFSSTQPDRLYQNGNPVYYNFTLKNLWSRNLTNVKVKINCPQLNGLTCECLDNPGSDVCDIGNLTSQEEKTVSFKISATEDTPTGDYVVNATVNYTNPANNDKHWPEQKPQTLEIRTIGIMEITPYEYPTSITRGESFEFKAYANNTGSQTASEAWLAYSSYPSGWSIASGQQNVSQTNVAPGEHFWNNVTFSTSISSSLGAQTIKLESASNLGQQDFKYVTIYVYGNTSLKLWVNDTNVSKGEAVRIYAKLSWDNSTAIPNEQISFYDETENSLIGTAATNSDGLAYVDYTISDSLSLGTHVINASFSGDTNIYANPSSNKTQINIGLKPFINSIDFIPSQTIGYGTNITIRANVTDDQTISEVNVTILTPKGEEYTKAMQHVSGDIYEAWFNDTWVNGTYNITVTAKDSYDSVNESKSYFVVEIKAGIVVRTEKDVYYPAEDVNLASAPLYPFKYKREITINNTLNQNLTEYQINLIINTSDLIANGKMKNDCSDIRFSWFNETSQKEEKIPYYLDYGCNSNETSIWVKVPKIYANNITKIYMYYGSDFATSESNASEVFSYSNEQTTFYVVSYVASSSSLNVVAFEDNTHVTFNGASTTLNKAQTYTFSASNSMTTGLAHDKPVFGAFSADTTDAIHPISWAGKRFVYYVNRGTNEWYFYAPFGDAQINISNSTHLKTTINLANGSAYRAQVDIEDGSIVIIESNVSILAQHAAASNNEDSRLLYPASTKLYGVPSNYIEVAAIEDGTHVDVYCSDGTTYSWDLNRGQGQSISGLGDEGTAPACVVIANKPVGANSLADSDGTETTTFLPLKELDKVYFLPQGAQYIAIAAPFATTCKLYDSSGTLQDTKSAYPNGNAPGKIYFGSTTDGTNIAAGSYIVCDQPVFAYYEYSGTSGGDETNIFGMKGNRKYAGIDLNYTIGNETVSGSAVFNYNAPFKGFIVATVEKNVSGTWQHITTLLNDTATNTVRDFSPEINDLSSIVPSWNPQGDTGEFRITVKIINPDYGLLNTTNGGQLVDRYVFNVTQVPLKLNISEIRVYEAPNNEHGGGTLIDSGINKTFNLEVGKTYRFEIDVDVLSDSQTWQINESNVTFSNLNQSWIIDTANNVWYLNQTDSVERSGGTFSSGILEWDTSNNDGYAASGTKVTFYFIVNLTNAIEEDRSVQFKITAPGTIFKDFDTLNIYQPDIWPPKLYNEIYGLNATEILRGEPVLAYARWDEEISDAKIEYNSTTNLLINNTITLPSPNPQNWTNYTIETSSLWLLGKHSIKIYASDVADNWNVTPTMILNVYGLAYVDSISVNDTTPQLNDYVKIECLVKDDTNSNGIENYNVMFWFDNTNFANSTTNSSGYASIEYQLTQPGSHIIKCNITNDTQNYYKIDSRNYKEQSIFVSEAEAPQWHEVSYPSLAHKGDTIKLSTRWTDNFELGYATLATNASGSYQNVSSLSLTGTDDWANFSYQVPTTMQPGYLAWKQYANDTSDNENVTNEYTIEIWGWSKIAEAYVQPASITQGDSTIMYCKVVDANYTSLAIEGYQVDFYLSGTYLGSNTTNSSGWAVYNFMPSSSGVYTVKCVIGDYVTKKYNASEINEGADTLTVVTGADVTPPKIIDSEYGLNDTSVYRGEAVLVYGHWDENLDKAWVEYNKTSSFVTETIPTPYPGNWTNYTITTGNDWTPGIHAVKLYANDTSGNINDTLDYLTFELWGRSGVYWIEPTTDQYRDTLTIKCQVKDIDTDTGIENYVVEFYNSTDYLGSNTTDANGYAIFVEDTTGYTPGEQTFYCKIQDDNTKYYDAIITQASKTINILGKLNVTILNPKNDEILERGNSYSLQSITKDEFGNVVTPDTANWYANENSIGTSENVSWNVPLSQQLGPTTLKINVTKSYYDSDEDSVNIYIYGHAQAKWISPNDGSYPAGKILQLVCFVNDSDTNSGIENYPVRFYYNGTLIGSSTTNATGYATINWDTSSLNGVYVVSCNITDDSTLYYNATIDSDYTTVEIYIDTTPPTVTIVNPENASYSITNINLNYSATDAHLDSCWYSLDNGANVSLPNCENTTLTSLSDGSHVVRVYANDTSGNEGYDEVYFTVDTKAPIITIVSPENKTYDTSWVWGNVSVNENVDWCGYSVDDSINTTMNSASPTYWYANISSLTDGTHKITFYCNDTAGNENSSAVYTTIDTTLPRVQLLEPEDNKILNTDYLTFICNASDNIKVANVSLLTNETGSLVIVETNTSRINGNYTFSRSVQDGAYEWTCQVCDYVHCVLASENRTVIADTQAPNVSLISPTNTTYNVDNVWLNYTVSDLTLDSCWYELDGVNHSLANCQNVSLTGLSNSAHHVIIFANDSLGRESYDEVYFTVDTIAPAINVQSPLNNTEYGVNYVSLNYTVSDNLGIDSCWYSLDNGANVSLPNCENTTLTGLDNGIHNVTVYVKDVAGNENYSYINFSVNSVAPVVNIIDPEEGKFYNVNDISLNYTVVDSDLDSCWYSLDNGANVSLPNCENTTLYDLTEGYHTIRVYANDSQAHESYDHVSFYVDTVAPIITVISPTNTSYTTSTIWLNYTIEDSYLDSCWYELDGVNHSLASCENISLSLTDGTHAIRVYANDSASNENASETVYFTVDTKAPIITIVSPENKTYTTSTINLNYTVSDNLGIDSCWYSLDNQENVTLASCMNTTINGIPDGSHAVTVYANDTAGNENSSTQWFTIDTTGPQITFVPPTPNDNQALDYNWTYINITTDEPANIAILEWNYNNGTIINYTMNSNTATNWWYNITNLQDGTYYYKVYANDSFDNWASTPERSVRISIGAPVIDIILPENVTYTQTNYLKLNVTSNKEIDTWWYSINGKDNITFTPNTSIAASIGTNEIKVYGNDSTGNIGWGGVVFTVDTNKWEDYFDHYSGIEEYKNASVENGKVKITFCYDFFEPECWPYRIPITLTNSQTIDLTDFQTNISIDTASLISSGKMNSDCSDIRFTYVNASGEYKIPYWIESGCNSDNTIIWVKVPKIAASSTATIYMYYGNKDVTSESNISEVFNSYSSTLSCQGSTAGGSCSVIFNAPAGKVFAPYGDLYFKMAGDFGYGGAYSSTDSICDENYERANVSVEGNGKGCYSTGIDGCALYAPSGFPVSVSNDIKDKSSVTVVGDSTSKVNGDPNSCGFYYKFEFTLNAYTRKDVTLPSFSLGSEQTNIRNATIMSIEIKPRKVARWDKFFAIHSTPTNTEITYEILDSNNNTLLTCDSTTASTGCDLSSITTNSIKLFAKLGTTTSETPELDYWNVSWTPNSSITITLVDENSQVNTNALLKLYKDTLLIAQGYGSVTTESEIYENHTLISDTSLASGHLVTKLHNLNITKPSLTIKQQIVEDYTGSLPPQIGNVTPVFALNDTELTFEKATLYIPKNGLKIDYILHCTDWDFSTATCNNWVLNSTTDYEGFGENATHFWFNVTNFEAYTGGQLAYDLKVNEITFNTSQPVENKPVLVTANISNEASSDIDSATIKLEVYYWNGSTWLLDSTQEKSISIAGNSYNLTNFTWYAKIGTYNFTVIADPSNLIDESDETNNVNYTIMNVSAWSIYYGVVNGWITIADNSGHNFTVWIPQTKEGNLYFADYDSNFDFDNLMPLNGANDLAEADQALNMSSFNDSIEHLFDKNGDGVADATDCFNIGTRLVCNVPIINSTDSNNGNFVTGILWDSGDGGTEYDGTQDLVFITKINPSKQGSYGTYDYEIRIPAYLRQLKPNTNLVKILFEIR